VVAVPERRYKRRSAVCVVTSPQAWSRLQPVPRPRLSYREPELWCLRPRRAKRHRSVAVSPDCSVESPRHESRRQKKQTPAPVTRRSNRMTLYSAATLGVLMAAIHRYEPGIVAKIRAMVATRPVPINLSWHWLAQSLLPVMPSGCWCYSPVWEPLVIVCMADMPAVVFTDLKHKLPETVGRAFDGSATVLRDGKSIVVRNARGHLRGWVKLRFVLSNHDT